MKLKDLLKSAWPQRVLLAVPFLVLVPLWDQFPPRVAIHWGLDGRPNGWADKEWGLLILPLTNVGLALLFGLRLNRSMMKNLDPEAQAVQGSVLKSLGLATGILMTSMALLIDAVALGWKLDVLRLVTLGLLALFAVLGNFLPELKPNRFVGIRTPWTLKSPEVWTRTHRLFGRIFLVGSLALILPCLFLPSWLTVLLLLGFLLPVSFGSMIYSYVCYRSLPSSGG